jgi:hypothetical protein
MQGQRDIDLNLFVFKGAKHPNLILFGDMWGKTYPVEKQMLDHIIHYLRQKKFAGNYRDYAISTDGIINDYGLRLDLKNELITRSELAYINANLEMAGWKDELRLPAHDWKNLNDIHSFQAEVRKLQKKLKPFKNLIATLVNERVTACFSPYQGKERQKARKRRITELRDQLKGSNEYAAFNPSMVFQLNGVPRLPPAHPEQLEQENFQKLLNETKEKLITRDLDGLLVDAILQDYYIFLGEYRQK